MDTSRISNKEFQIELFIDELHKAEKSGIKARNRLIGFFWIAIGLLTIRFCVETEDMKIALIGTALFFLPLGIILSAIVLYMKNENFISSRIKNKLKNTHRRKLIQTYLQALPVKTEFHPLKKINNSILKQSRLLHYNEYKGCDRISLKHDDAQIYLCNAKLMYGVKKVFSGTLICLAYVDIPQQSIIKAVAKHSIGSEKIRSTIIAGKLFIMIPHNRQFLHIPYYAKQQVLTGFNTDQSLIKELAELLAGKAVQQEATTNDTKHLQIQ